MDRVYPRDARAALAGSTLTVTGRLRGKLPDHIGFRYRRGAELVHEQRSLDVIPVPAGGDVARRWAQARIDELSTREIEGIEPAIALAVKAQLLTPWTGWFFGASNASMPFESRVLALSPTLDAPYAARVEPVSQSSSLLLEPPPDFTGDESVHDAAVEAAQREIEEAVTHLQACRDARAAVRPDVTGSLRVDMTVDGGGRATDVHVSAVSPQDDDPVLDRCAKGVVGAITFFASGLRISVTQELRLPPARTPRRTQCSVASQLPLPVRRGIWRARMRDKGVSAGDAAAREYTTAAQGCELPAWNERRAFLEILMGLGVDGVQLSSGLEDAGETDAATFVRHELLRRVTSAAELARVSHELVRHEPRIDAALDKAYRAARTDDDRLAVVRRFLLLAPHNALARRRLLIALEALGKNDVLIGEIDRIRTDPFADAGLLAMGASALRRLGRDDEGRRAFGELIERAPRDRWALAFVGDRLRAEGLLRRGGRGVRAARRRQHAERSRGRRSICVLAHAGAGRLDVATRTARARNADGRTGRRRSPRPARLGDGGRRYSRAPGSGRRPT